MARGWHEVFMVIAYMLRLNRIITILAAVLLTNSVVANDSTDYTGQRDDFLAAERALKSGRLNDFHQLMETLETYPLYPYLLLEDMRRHLSKTPINEVEDFLNRYADSPLEKQLRHAWLESLARHDRWQDYLKFYQATNNTELQCQYKWALLKTGKAEQAYENIEHLWLVGYSQPRVCDRVFNAWYHSGGMTQGLVWNRIQLAMNKRKLILARYLTRFQTPENQKWSELWIKVHSRPSLILTRENFSADHPMRNAILVYGVKRLAQSNPLRAIKIWNTTLSHRYPFDDDDRADLERYFAMVLAVRGKPEALSWLAVIEPGVDDDQLREWRVRSALNQENWDAVLAWINQLNDDQLQSPRWQYWRARALETQGQQDLAEEMYFSLAQTRSYYGFWSADRVEAPYHLNASPLAVNQEDLSTIEAYPGILRAHELYLLDRIIDARREWYYATYTMGERQLRQAAKLAQNWGWHDRAILTIARTQYSDDLEMRFPLAHHEQILAQAKINNIDPAFAYAIIRQESAFTADARSHAGALGLMQVMPRTAQQLAKGLDIRINHTFDILDITKNLQFGMKYLRKTLNRYDNHPVLATAAYNAGPYRVNKWLPERGNISSDLWTETLPLAETRNYIQNIMAYTAIYERRMGKEPTPITERMPPINSANTTVTINNKQPSFQIKTHAGGNVHQSPVSASKQVSVVP